MPRRGRKGGAPLFNTTTRLKLLSDDESDEESSMLPKMRRRKGKKVVEQHPIVDSEIVDLCEENSPTTIQLVTSDTNREVVQMDTLPPEAVPGDAAATQHPMPLDCFLHRSNLEEIVVKFLQKHFPEAEQAQRKNGFLEYFYKIYHKFSTSRRCQDINLHHLVMHPPPLSSGEIDLLEKHQIKSCTVSMETANVLVAIEKRIYSQYRKCNPFTTDFMDFIQSMNFQRMAMDYLSYILPNVVKISKVPKIHQKELTEKLVKLLFEKFETVAPYVDTETARGEENGGREEQANETEDLNFDNLTLQEPQNPTEAATEVPTRLKILDFNFQDHFLITAKGIEQSILRHLTLEFPLTIYTPDGPIDIVLRGDDIGRFTFTTSMAWTSIKKILGNIVQDIENVCLNQSKLERFSSILSNTFKVESKPGVTRYYIPHGEANENCIEIEYS